MNNTYFIIDILQLICSIGLLIGVWVAIANYKEDVRENNESRKYQRISKSIELAEYYKTNVLKNISAINHLYEKLGVSEIISSLKSNEMSNFDDEESIKLLGNDNIKKLDELHLRKDYISIVLLISTIYHLDLYGVEFKQENGVRTADVSPDELRSCVMDICSDILNSLEYFAMNFNTGVADETVVYESLNQTYILGVKYLYRTIAKLNKRAAPTKYYTNIIDLFKKWSARFEDNVLKSEKINLTTKKSTM